MQAALATIETAETTRESTATVYRHSPVGIGSVLPDRAGTAKRQQAGNWGKPWRPGNRARK